MTSAELEQSLAPTPNGRTSPPPQNLDREVKLLLVAATLAVVVGLVSAWPRNGAGSAREAASWLMPALCIPLFFVLRRWAPAGGFAVLLAWLASVATVGGTVALVARPEWIWRSGFLDAYERAGWLGAAVPLILLGVPLRRALDAFRGPARGVGAAGFGLVAGHAALALAWPALADPQSVLCYLSGACVIYAFASRRESAHYATPATRHQTLSVTLITKNEEDRVARCLESVAGWADEIVVLDSGSTDSTVEIVRRYTEKVWVTDWPGYGPQKQRALERATCDWVLSIDADEELTPELRHDIDRALGPRPTCVGYRLPWGVVVYGKLLDFGRSARAPLRLFRREGSRFTDARVHETIRLPAGRVGRLRGRLLHYTQRDFGHALQKGATYGWLGAQQRFAKGRRGAGLPGATLRGLIVFLQVYFVRLGFLDGQPGFLMAMLYAQVAFNKYAGLWAIRRERAATRPR